MKKLFAVALCLAMLLSCAAMAENTDKAQMGTLNVKGAFTLQCALPEGYMLVPIYAEDNAYRGLITPVDEASDKPIMMLSIAYDDLMDEIDRMNDLDDEALAKIEATFTDEDDVEISYMETTYGTKVMVIKEIADGIDYVDFYSIYKGYGIEFVLTQAQVNAGVAITDEQIQMAMSFLSELDFVPAE